MSESNRPRREVHLYDVALILTEREWHLIEEQAAETGISADLLISLVMAFMSRAKLCNAACLALHDVSTGIWRLEDERTGVAP